MRLKSIFLFLVLIFCATAHALPPGKIPNVYGVTYGTDAYIRYGTHEDSLCGFNSDQGDGGLTCGVAAAGQFFLLMDKADLAVDSGVTDLGTPQFVVANSDPTKWVTMYHNGTNAVIHTNTGVVTFPEGLDLGAGSMSFGASLVFEGATADAFETTLTVVDPATSDKTITLPNQTGAVVLSPAGVADTANAVSGGTGTFVFEGATADAFETSLQATDTTASDKTVSLPDQTGTVLLSVGGAADAANAISGGTGSFVFEGSTADAFETTLNVTDPTSDVTVTLPNSPGIVHTSGAYAQFSSASPTDFTGATTTLLVTNNVVKLQCNRTGPADTAVTLDETGAVVGQVFWAYVDGNANNAGTCSFADSAGVQQASARTLDDWDTISFVYTGAEWVELGGVNN